MADVVKSLRQALLVFTQAASSEVCSSAFQQGTHQVAQTERLQRRGPSPETGRRGEEDKTKGVLQQSKALDRCIDRYAGIGKEFHPKPEPACNESARRTPRKIVHVTAHPASAESTPAYFVLYGSKDQDTTGWQNGSPPSPGALSNSGFAAYDRAGTEADTSGPVFQHWMTKAMIFAYGAPAPAVLTRNRSSGRLRGSLKEAGRYAQLAGGR